MAFDKKKFIGMEPMYYWQPKEGNVEADIIENPDKYSDYIGAFKKDGEWAMMIWDGKEVIIRSRSISKKTNEYARKEESLPHLVEVFKQLPAGTVILGELCYDDLYKRSKDVGTILRCLPDKAIERQEKDAEKLRFYAFDVLAWDGVDITNKGFEHRIVYLDLIADMLPHKFIRFAKYKTPEEIANEYEDYLAAGGEGFVLQKKDNPYAPGKRTAWATIKLKKHTEEIELPVIGFIDPIKEYTGKELDSWQYFEDGQPVTKYYYMGWKAGVEVDNNGSICRVASGITDSDAQWLSTPEAQNYLLNGQIYAKCSAMEIEKDTGRMRHPRMINLNLKELRTDL